MNKNYLKLFVMHVLLTPVLLYFLGSWINFPGDTIKPSTGETDWGFLHWFYCIVSIVAYIAGGILLSVAAFDPDEFNLEKESKPSYSWVKTLILAALLLIGLSLGSSTYTGCKELYNASVLKTNTYQQKTDALQGFYDMLWKTYLQKEKITNVSKDVFVEVTKIIMENRKDGQAVTWKWLHENQQIPYSEFTSFYKDLSVFIESKRDEYYNLEKERQQIVNDHNTMLKTFPNNFYNWIIGRPQLVYKYGFLSDSTRSVFSSGVENVK